MADDDEQVRDEFADAVNMTRSELSRWLETDESKSVGQKKDGAQESTGHESGRHILELLQKKADDLTDDDLHEMRRVTGYVKRHLAQEPSSESIEDSRWRYSLMNWGHDPLKRG